MRLKRALSNWRIRSVLSKRQRIRQFVNLQEVITAGVIWREGHDDSLAVLEKCFNDFGIDCHSICYARKSSETAFSKKSISLFGKAKSKSLANFIGRKFDILIDISLVDNVEMRLVRALSYASFKVGARIREPNYLDFDINLGENKDPKFLAEQIVYYLCEINKPLLK